MLKAVKANIEHVVKVVAAGRSVNIFTRRLVLEGMEKCWVSLIAPSATPRQNSPNYRSRSWAALELKLNFTAGST